MALPSYLSESKGALLVRVKVMPRSSRAGVDGIRGGSLLIRVKSPPVEGRANTELRRVLARAVGVPPSAVTVVRGTGGRQKTLRVDGIEATSLVKKLVASGGEG